MQILLTLSISLMAAGWLLPNHYLPWLSAWGDGVTSIGLIFLLICVLAKDRCVEWRIDYRLLILLVIFVVVVIAQLLTGRLLYLGDAIMVVAYIFLWFGAILGGMVLFSNNALRSAADTLFVAWILAALISVGVALAQWTGAVNLYEFGADFPLGGRPFANVGQPNHLNTLCFIGVCALLFLSQTKKISTLIEFVGVGFLLFGMVMSQSRTGWIQIGVLLVWGAWLYRRVKQPVSWPALVFIGGIYFSGVVFWSSICDFLMLSQGRSLGEQMQSGVRGRYWLTMLDAIGREPLSGYGWLQTGLAQQQVATNHLPIGALFDHSHNLVLDLMLWMGIPVALIIISLWSWWFFEHLRESKDGFVFVLLIMISGVAVHAMLEYPLAYAYFLIPFGLVMGGVESLTSGNRKSLVISRFLVMSFVGVFAAFFSLVALDYLKIEERFRNLRFEIKRIGIDKVKPEETHAIVLTQLEALMTFYKTEARPNMEPEQLDSMRKVSERYGYPPVLLRYALASGLNFQPAVAEITLARLCSIHLPARCEEARESWGELTVKYPQLSEVRFPESPWIKQGLK